ncbi:MAG: dTDP-4-dehydrorhamnose reductase [Bacilli bacterium]
MRYFITGYKGQLGYDLARELIKRNELDIIISDRGNLEEGINDRAIELKNKHNLSFYPLDITDKEAVDKLITEVKPDVILHCAAWTAVDIAEDMYDKVYDVNVVGTENLVEAARNNGSKIVYISSDYVFDGTKDGIYTEEDEVNPLSVYGKTKYLGEEMTRKYDKHFIVRISWVYGINGKNFVKTMLNLSETKDELGVVCDQIGSPTYTPDVSRLLIDMVQTDKYGTYNGTNENYCSWADFARKIFEINNCNVKVNDVLTKDYVTNATRPLNSKLSKEKLVKNGFQLLPTWEDALNRYCDELIEENQEVGKIIIKNREGMK